MKNIINKLINGLLLAVLFFSQACKESILDEEPLSFLGPDITLVNNAGFQSAITALHEGERLIIQASNWSDYWALFFGTDIGSISVWSGVGLKDYLAELTPSSAYANFFWEWGYLKMLPRANQIIDYAERPTAIWKDENEKNAVIAEARFFRARVYNVLTTLYGDVPIVDKVSTVPKVDYIRNPRRDVLEFVKADLEFASQWLPLTEPQPGRIVKYAADHLLAEVNISLGNFDEAINAATSVITSGHYQLMTSRFGTTKDQPGDVFSDMFKDGNQNRSGGNLENIWVVQYEFQTPGGAGPGKLWPRCWGCWYENGRDPNNASGFVLTEGLGRMVGFMRPCNHVIYGIWADDPNDMRNSPYNIRRKWYYNNPKSAYYGQLVTYHPYLDTMINIFPIFRKIEGISYEGVTSGNIYSDWPRMRLAETYLLRAEAYLMKGDKQKAADDINVVRGRSNAKPVNADKVDLDYILDERLRELIIEEPRRLTLNRMGKFVERTRKYNTFPITLSTIKDYHNLFPIPQKFIDANFGAKTEQNPGY